MTASPSRPPPSGERRLPELTLASAPDGAPRPLRPRGRHNHVIALLHGGGCEACAEWVRELGRGHEPLREWDGRVTVVASGDLAATRALRERAPADFGVLADPAGEVARRCGVSHPAVLVADQWGEIFGMLDGAEHRLPPAAEILEWVRFVAIQCPECQGEAW